MPFQSRSVKDCPEVSQMTKRLKVSPCAQAPKVTLYPARAKGYTIPPTLRGSHHILQGQRVTPCAHAPRVSLYPARAKGHTMRLRSKGFTISRKPQGLHHELLHFAHEWAVLLHGHNTKSLSQKRLSFDRGILCFACG